MSPLANLAIFVIFVAIGAGFYQNLMTSKGQNQPIIVVGGGLAGLSASHEILQRGGSVVIVEKEARLGGNSMKASSGMNSAASHIQDKQGVDDSAEDLLHDTVVSATGKPGEGNALQKVLAESSAAALKWLTESFGIDLAVLSQCGGHSHSRTHRPTKGPAGAGIMITLIKKIEALGAEMPERIKIINNARLVSIIRTGDEVTGIQIEVNQTEQQTLTGTVILATGGYANDHTDSSLLKQHVPEVASLPTTNGPWAKGEGVKAAVAIGASTIDLDKVQVHPTGFVDPKAPEDLTKFLCAEAIRASGAILVNGKGKRFVNELGLRAEVTAAMDAQGSPIWIILNQKGGSLIETHIGFYKFKGLMSEYSSVDDLATGLNVDPNTLKQEFAAYNNAATDGNDPTGKTRHLSVPFEEGEKYYAGQVTPVLHYTMGGLQMTANAEILDETNKIIKGLYGAGEVTGGVHGKNRLAGNSLLECVVFGRIAGQNALSAAA